MTRMRKEIVDEMLSYELIDPLDEQDENIRTEHADAWWGKIEHGH